MFPAKSAPLKLIVYSEPSTKVGLLVKVIPVWSPDFNSSPANKTVSGEELSSEPPVRVQMILPHEIVSLREYVIVV